MSRPHWWAVGQWVVALALTSGFLLLAFSPPPEVEAVEAPAFDIPEAPPLEDLAVHCEWPFPPEGFSDMVHQVAAEVQLNPRVLALTVYRESKCNASARGGVGEIGLGQIYPAVWESTLKKQGIITSVDDLYDPEVNLRATAYVLNDAFKSSRGKAVDALRIYNGRGKRAIRYSFQQRDRYRALWGEDVSFRSGSVGEVRAGTP